MQMSLHGSVLSQENIPTVLKLMDNELNIKSAAIRNNYVFKITARISINRNAPSKNKIVWLEERESNKWILSSV